MRNSEIFSEGTDATVDIVLVQRADPRSATSFNAFAKSAVNLNTLGMLNLDAVVTLSRSPSVSTTSVVYSAARLSGTNTKNKLYLNWKNLGLEA